MRKSRLIRFRTVTVAIAAALVAGCAGDLEDAGMEEYPHGKMEQEATSPVAQTAINFGLSQLSSRIGSVYVGGCSGQRFGGTAGGYFNGSCTGQSNYYQSPGKVGYDCSGLVHRMLAEAGINLGSIDSSTEMYDQLTSITKSQLLPGDLLVKRGSHVVMYIGDTNGDGVTEVIEATPYDDNGYVTYNGATYRNNWNGVRTLAASNYINNSDYHARQVPGVQTASPPPAPPPTGWGPLYRYYNSATTDHFYTRDWSELGSGKNGYIYEFPEGQIAGTQLAGTVPLYRLYYPNRDHYYTVNAVDKSNAQAAGWTYEGVAGYVLPPNSTQTGARPVYRYWNASVYDHFYTLTPVSVSGYSYEMVAWMSP